MVDARVHAKASSIGAGRLEHDLEALLPVQADARALTAVARLGDEALLRRQSSVAAALVPVRTVALAALLTAAGEAADSGLPDFGMVLLLFPAVAMAAAVFVWATVGILADEIFRLPAGAGHWIVPVFLRLPPQVLPVMRVDALLFVMLEGKRTPGGLEIEHVEVCVLRHLMK